ncbi:alpha/beta hydrolase [bacterium CPR1]|nr:alpha/beta hydrolase [bacterium CPR1]
MSENILLDGIKVNVERSGPLDGQPVLLLHGNGASWNAWALNLHHLGPEWLALAPDLPGFGESDAPDHFYSIPDFARLLWKLVEGKRPVLVGNSLGSLIAFEMAAQGEAAGLMLVAAPACVPDEMDPQLARLITWFDQAGVPQIPNLKELGLVTVSADERILTLANANMARARGFLPALPAIWNYRWEMRTDQIRCPVCLVWGEQDGLVSRSHLERWQRALPQASTVTLARAAHGPQFDDPEGFNQALLAFLSELRSAGRAGG